MAGLQIVFHLAQADCVDVGLRRDSQHRLECPLQVEGAAAEFFG